VALLRRRFSAREDRLTGRISEDQFAAAWSGCWNIGTNTTFASVNISAGGDFEESYLTNELSQTLEQCTREGLIVVCAVGNAGHMPGHPVLPPASAPSSIAVGGLDDQNSSIARARHVSIIVWTDRRWTPKTGSDCARNLGRGADSASHATAGTG
jgi:hypothetical protein